ncbi:MAG: hypothetical protein WC326_15285 [Candidatus Delongbacteria bacterium]
MKVLWFYVFEFHPDSTRKQPIGAWIWVDGALDYVFDPAYPEDEAIPSDLINRMLEAGVRSINQAAFEYWQTHLGYFRSSSQVYEEEVSNLKGFASKISSALLGS